MNEAPDRELEQWKEWAERAPHPARDDAQPDQWRDEKTERIFESERRRVLDACEESEKTKKSPHRGNGWLVKRVSTEYVYVQVDQLVFDTQDLFALRRALESVESGRDEERSSKS